MKQLIKDVLDDMSTGQITLSSNSARELIATTVAATLKSNGTYLKDSEVDKQIAREREKWVCSICGENTFDVDYDYIGSDTNHLGCELKVEMGSEADAADYYTGPDGHYERYGDIPHSLTDDEEVYHIIKHLGYDTKDKKQTVVGKISESQLNNLYPWHEEEQ
jgi:hypothetical protein|tara:strand:- start:98 stop:586 length:489 start_codon:yes stop_codon:yes gene_type:complete